MPDLNPIPPRVVVISGGTDGMGRALALSRVSRGDSVVVLGSNPAKGQSLRAEADRAGAGGRVDFLQVDLSSVAQTRTAIDNITARYETIDALALFANRQAPKRVTTSEGLEQTFALYYLSRYLLSHGLAPQLRRSETGVVVNVAGVGTLKGDLRRWRKVGSAHQ